MKNLKDMTKIRSILFYIKDTIKVHPLKYYKLNYIDMINTYQKISDKRNLGDMIF